jgi:multidrug/hemolysin transport system ATP-binding protein
MQQAILVEQLKKSYGSVEAVKGIDFFVQKGQLFAFLGENGAGKSTTIDILCTLLRPDAGKAFINGFVLGKEDEQIRKSIGVVFQDNLLDPLLTVRENIQIRAGFYGLTPAEVKENTRLAIRWVEALDFENRPYGKLSGGQRRKADIARALVHTPSILFLDEPTTGLDPHTRQIVWNTVRSLQKQSGMTVFLTTHYMEEAAAADYAAVMVRGEIKAKGTPAALREAYSSDSLRLIPKDKQGLELLLKELSLPYEQKGGAYRIKLSGTLQAIPILERVRPYIDGLEVLSGSMDDTFINITGQEFKGGQTA